MRWETRNQELISFWRYRKGRNLAMMGVFPDTFHAFLRGIGHPTGEVRAVSRKLAFVMRAHLRGLYFTYQTLTREKRPLGTHPEPSTSGTPRRARRGEATTAERRRKAMRREIRMGKAPARCPEDPAHELRLASGAAQRIYGGANQEEWAVWTERSGNGAATRCRDFGRGRL